MVVRNLVQALASKVGQTKAADPAEPALKKAKVEAENDSHLEDQVEDINRVWLQAEGKQYGCFVDSFVLSLSEDGADAALEEGDSVKADCLTKVQGIYWKIDELDGVPVYRQEKDTPHGKELVMFCRKTDTLKGWWIAEKFFYGCKQKHRDEAGAICWMESSTTGDDILPPHAGLHVKSGTNPSGWDSQPAQGLTVLTLVEHLVRRLRKVEAALDQSLNDTKMVETALEQALTDKAVLEAAVDQSKQTVEHDDGGAIHVQEYAGPMARQGLGRLEQDGTFRKGGWMNRSADVMAALLAGRTNWAMQYTQEY